jgi:hypothetical protein
MVFFFIFALSGGSGQSDFKLPNIIGHQGSEISQSNASIPGDLLLTSI